MRNKIKKQRIRTVVRFSESLKLDAGSFVASGVLDPILGVDIKVFVDPQRLFRTKVPEFMDARAKLEKYFADVFRLIRLSKSRGDFFYKRAVSSLTFKETKGVGIGFGKDTDDGRGIGVELATRLVDTAIAIHERSVNDPAVFELLSLFEEDFGPDRLSDLTIFILRADFLRFTERAARDINIPGLKDYEFKGDKFRVPFRAGREIPITLLPLDLIKDLPIAADPKEIKDAGYLNTDLRESWRLLLSEAYKAGNQHPGKDRTKELFLANPKYFAALLKVYKENETGPYDFVRDPKGLISWANFAAEFAANFPLDLPRSINTASELENAVSLILDQFQRNIEQNGLNKLLFKENGRAHREAYAQLLFFASADAYCRANGLDLSPESDAGRGPVDFKVSKGKLKVVVELKLSKHKELWHGFEKQLQIYKAAEAAQHGFYVVVRVAETLPAALKQIEATIAKRHVERKPSSKLRIIDGRLQPSASKPGRRKRDRPK